MKGLNKILHISMNMNYIEKEKKETQIEKKAEPK